MTHATRSSRLPLRLRLFTALQREPDWSAMSPEELAEYSDARNRAVASPPARLLTGLPDRAATIDWQRIDLPDRSLPVRVYRRSPRRGDPETDLPLVLHVHGGGSTGTAVQCDWLNGHIAARLPAVVYRSNTGSSPRTSRSRRPSTTAGTHCATWCTTPRAGESIPRGRPSSARAPER